MIVHQGSLDVHFMNELLILLRVGHDVGVVQELLGFVDCRSGEVGVMLVNLQCVRQNLPFGKRSSFKKHWSKEYPLVGRPLSKEFWHIPQHRQDRRWSSADPCPISRCRTSACRKSCALFDLAHVTRLFASNVLFAAATLRGFSFHPTSGRAWHGAPMSLVREPKRSAPSR